MERISEEDRTRKWLDFAGWLAGFPPGRRAAAAADSLLGGAIWRPPPLRRRCVARLAQGRA